MHSIFNIHHFLIFYAGISFLGFFYWMIVYIYSKNRNYLLLASATITMAIFMLYDFSEIYFFPKAEALVLAFVQPSFCGLAAELNNFKKNLSSIVYNAFVAYTVSAIAFELFSPLVMDWKLSYSICVLLPTLGQFIVSSLFAYLWMNKHQPTARFAFFVNIPGTIGYTLFSFSRIGLLSPAFAIAGPLGFALFLLMLFYGMVTYVIALRAKRDKEHREKEELIMQQNILLEKKVEERTRELEEEKELSEELLIKASQKQMIELELQSLRAQLNPHFMYNSLNAIQELIVKEDFENSHNYLSSFAKLLRMLLETTEKPFTSLQKELEFLELYISLEKLRLPNLEFTISMDPCINKEQTLIPNMILQPFIENALWHGLSNKPGERKLELKIEKQNDIVTYHVKDNGIGRKRSAELKVLVRNEHKSKGLELLNKRFKLLNDEFGSEIQTEVCDVVDNGCVGGTEVFIRVPDSLVNHAKNNQLYDTRHYN